MTKEWTELHPDFAKTRYSDQTWQQKWAKKGWTPATAQAWIALGFEPADLWRVQRWINRRFAPEEAGSWLAVGLSKYSDSAFAAWLRDNNHTPHSAQAKLAQLRTEYKNQVWLTEHYPDRSIKRLAIWNQDLIGPLNLSHYPQLEELICVSNQLINLDLTGCVNLREISCSNNQLTSLNFLTTLPHPAKLTYLDLNYNPLATTLDSLAALVNLEELDLWNTKVHGSLASLSQCRKLKELDISHTQLASDLECLPAQLETIYAAGMPALAEKMAGFVEDERYGKYDYQAWRKANQENINLIIQLIDSNKLKDQSIKELNDKLTHPRLDDIIFQLITWPTSFFQPRLLPEKANSSSDFESSWNNSYLIFSLPVIWYAYKRRRRIGNLFVDKRETAIQTEDWLATFIPALQVKNESSLNSSAEQEVLTLPEKIEEFQKSQTSYQQELEKKEIENDTLQSQLTGLQQALEAEQTSRQQAKLKLDQTLAELAKLHQAAQQTQQDLTTTQTSLQEQLDKVKQETQTFQKQITQLQTELNDAENRYQTIAQELEQQTANLADPNWTEADLQAAEKKIDELETSLNLGKYAKFGESTAALSGVGSAISIPTFGLVKLVGELGLAANNSAKLKFLEKKINEFNHYLLTDEQKLSWWQTRYDANLDNNAEQSFADKYHPFNIINNVWKNKSYLSLDEMKDIINSLTTNHKSLERELREQEKDLAKLLEQGYQTQQEHPTT